MKIGLYSITYLGCWYRGEALTLPELIHTAKKFGYDGVEIDGTPPLKMRIDGGIQGDLATASIMANCVPAIARSRMVGLLTMRDLPLLPYTRPRPQPREDFE